MVRLIQDVYDMHMEWKLNMPFYCANISTLNRKLTLQVPLDLPIQCHPFPLLQPPPFWPFYRYYPLTIHSTWIVLNTCPITIFMYRFEACLPKYVENSMMVLGNMMLPERVELMKVRKDFNIFPLLVFLVSTLFISLVVAGQLFESDSIILQNWR